MTSPTWTGSRPAPRAVRPAPALSLVAEDLCESAGVRAGWRVLDVASAAGSGTVAAARRGCAVEGVEAESAALPFADASFDAAVSVFGLSNGLAAELVRVCKPGAPIALACRFETTEADLRQAFGSGVVSLEVMERAGYLEVVAFRR